MGFRVDGCGTYDKNKPLIHLGEYYCTNCKKVCGFKLYETKKKITILYVPVARISKKYGVYCDKCQRGYAISEIFKDRIVSGDYSLVDELLQSADMIDQNN